MPSTESFLTKANHRIFYRHWKPESQSNAVIILIHGLGEHSGRYEYQGDNLAKAGLEAYAFDNIGHGLSSGRRGFVNSFKEYLEVLDEFASFVLKENGGKPLFIIGHSLGGLIAASYALEACSAKVKGIILSSPSLGIPSPIKPNILEQFLIKILSAIWPTLELPNRIDPHLLSRDKDVVERYIADSLVFRTITPRLFTEILKAQERLLKKAGSFTLPCLMLIGKSDKITPPESLLKFYDSIASKGKGIKAYDGLYHEVLNEPEKGSVLADLKGWLKEFLLI